MLELKEGELRMSQESLDELTRQVPDGERKRTKKKTKDDGGGNTPPRPNYTRVEATRSWGEGWEAVPVCIVLLALIVGGTLAVTAGVIKIPGF